MLARSTDPKVQDSGPTATSNVYLVSALSLQPYVSSGNRSVNIGDNKAPLSFTVDHALVTCASNP
jgi:chloramphenicol O-acetyltransferase